MENRIILMKADFSQNNIGRFIVVDELKLGDMVTITGIDLEYNRPSDKPVSAAITYRVSDKIQERFTRARQMGTRIFDDSFDKTFE